MLHRSRPDTRSRATILDLSDLSNVDSASMANNIVAIITFYQ